MSYYERLINKANACRKAAARTEGLMREIWLNKAERLETIARGLPVYIAAEKNY